MSASLRAALGLAAIVALLGISLLWRATRPRNAEIVSPGEGQPRQALAPSYAARSFVVMATRVDVAAPSGRVEAAVRQVGAVFREIDGRMSEWKPTSPLSAVNRAAGRAAVEVPADLRRLIRRGIALGERTNGAFDISWAALWGLWDFKASVPRVPPASEIARRRALVDYRQVQVDEAAGTVKLARPGMKVGLGAIAKGYALDQAAARLRRAGLASFMISAGGQVLAAGRRGDRAWRVGIRDPRGASPEDYFAVLELRDTSASTSGDYERFFVIDGKRYHHILDPRSGMPSRGLRSVTIVCPDATRADALSTAVMVLGVRRGMELVRGYSDVEAVLVDAEGKVHTSAGIGHRLRIVHAPRP